MRKARARHTRVDVLNIHVPMSTRSFYPREGVVRLPLGIVMLLLKMRKEQEEHIHHLLRMYVVRLLAVCGVVDIYMLIANLPKVATSIYALWLVQGHLRSGSTDLQ